MSEVTAAIVTYRSEAELPACLDSVLRSDVSVTAVVIDNSPDEGTLSIARGYERDFSNVRVIRSGGNIGLAAANNLVMPFIDGEFALMLNPDTVLEVDTISKMIQVMREDARVGAVGPMNVYEGGKPFSSYQRAWNLAHVFLWRVLPYSFTRWLYDRWSLYREADVFYVSGSCLLVRSELFKRVGGYDPRLFLTIEDVCDLCRRIGDLGFHTRFTPRTRLVHFCSRSAEQVPYLTTLCTYTGSVYYFTKHNGRLGGFLAFSIVVLGCLTKIFVSGVKVVLGGGLRARRNLSVYWRIFPELIRKGMGIVWNRGDGPYYP